MANAGKRFKGNQEKVDRSKRYDVEEAVKILKTFKVAKFDESVDVAIRLGVDPRQSDQMVRGVVKLPHGTGKKVRVLVFAKGEKEQEAKDAGADFVGSEDLVEKIKGGWLDFDRAIATPDMMAKIGPIAKILGPRGLMPNPKVGTVTKDIGKAVVEQKAGAVEFRVEKAGIIHAPIGRLSFEADKLRENFMALLEQVVKQKPASAKGIYLLSISLSSTMSPGIKIDPAKASAVASKG
jgi:large subunit ribosomal protein L1